MVLQADPLLTGPLLPRWLALYVDHHIHEVAVQHAELADSKACTPQQSARCVCQSEYLHCDSRKTGTGVTSSGLEKEARANSSDGVV